MRYVATMVMLLGCAVFGYMRLTMDIKSQIHSEDIFKDMAHLFVGDLFGLAKGFTAAWIAVKAYAKAVSMKYMIRHPLEGFFGWSAVSFWIMAIGMTVLEVIAFKLHE